MLKCALCRSSLPNAKYGRHLRDREARQVVREQEGRFKDEKPFACLLCLPRVKWMLKVTRNLKDVVENANNTTGIESATSGENTKECGDEKRSKDGEDINEATSKQGFDVGNKSKDVAVKSVHKSVDKIHSIKSRSSSNNVTLFNSITSCINSNSSSTSDGILSVSNINPCDNSMDESTPGSMQSIDVITDGCSVNHFNNEENSVKLKDSDGQNASFNDTGSSVESCVDTDIDSVDSPIIRNTNSPKDIKLDNAQNLNKEDNFGKENLGMENNFNGEKVLGKEKSFEKITSNRSPEDCPNDKETKELGNKKVVDYVEGMAKCSFCSYTVPKKRAGDIIRVHIPRIHPEKASLLATYEARLSSRRDDLRNRATLSCLLCGQTATKLSNLSRHYTQKHGFERRRSEMKTQEGDGTLCPICGEFFLNKHQQIRHLMKKHTLIDSGDVCPFCPYRYVDLFRHIHKMHREQMNSSALQCTKCLPHQHFSTFEELLRHVRVYHKGRGPRQGVKSSRKTTRKTDSSKTSCTTATSATTSTMTMTKTTNSTSSTMTKMSVTTNRTAFDPCAEQENERHSKKYVPIHLSGICPFCDRKFADLLGHIRHGHKRVEELDCRLCDDRFASVRELVTHRQLHPQFRRHDCHKCGQQTDTVKELREHRLNCPKIKRRLQRQIRVPNVGVNEMFEGRGTVNCFLCPNPRSFTLKCLLRRHLVSQHGYDHKQAINALPATKEDDGHKCDECGQSFGSFHQMVKHRLDFHCRLSGEICPYCESKWGSKKFEQLDDHVAKYHELEMQSPIQTCATCKTNFSTYEDLKRHRQLHDGNVQLGLPAAETHNRGGVKCLLCNAFKTRKDHLRVHYRRRHGYNPKLVVSNGKRAESAPLSEFDSVLSSCPCCHILLSNTHTLIKHLLRAHTHYSGQICPYCVGHFPARFINLQAHVTSSHLDRLVGYNVVNTCMVCDARFAGYAELRDHVQTHGDGYRIMHRPTKDPRIEEEEVVTTTVLEPGLESLPSLDHRDVAMTLAAEGEEDNNTSFSTLLLDELIKKCDEGETHDENENDHHNNSDKQTETDIDLLAPTC